MKFKDLLAQRIPAIRKDFWVRDARIEFHFTDSGHVGPWVTLVSPIEQEAMGTEPVKIGMWDAEDDDDCWEAYRPTEEAAGV